MLFVSYSMIDHYVKNLQVKGYNIRIQQNRNGKNSVYWVIKVNEHDVCRFYGKNKICGIVFKKEYCTKEEWSYFINHQDDSVDTGNGQFRGYKLHYNKHDFHYYMNWITDHITIACLLNKWK